MVEVRRCQTLADAEQYALVLAAVGIECQLVPGNDTVGLYVSPIEAERARQQLSSYEQENAPEASEGRPLSLVRPGCR